MKLLIVVYHRLDLWNAPAWFVERLRREFPQVAVVSLPSYEGIEEQIEDAEILIAFSLRLEQFEHARQLRWIHSPAAAVHQLMFPELVKSNVIVTNARDTHGPVVAEHVIALIFALAKKLPQALRFQQQHVWGQEAIWHSQPPPEEIAGATLGLIGLGSIGQPVAHHGAALGMRVIASRENPQKPKPDFVDQVFPSAQVEDLLSQSDYVVLSPPLTSETRGLMDARRFAAMKPNAHLINVGRGPLVDERALASVLRERKIAGAALDVFETEPLPPDSPLWDLENLLITPHTAGMTAKLWERHYGFISENLRRYLGRRPLLAVVDKQKGY